MPDDQEFPEFSGMSRNSPTLAVFLENGEFLHFFKKTQEVGVFLKKVLRNRKKVSRGKKSGQNRKKCSGTEKSDSGQLFLFSGILAPRITGNRKKVIPVASGAIS